MRKLATASIAVLVAVVVAGGFAPARAARAKAATRSAPAAAAAPAIDADLFSGMKARSIGPAGMSGRVAAIDAVESNPDIVFVGAATGGLWKSTNGGITFRPVFDDQPVASIGAIAINQQNPDIVWVGTGEGNVRNSASVGDGVYKSSDGGETWTHVGLEGSERIRKIVLDPRDSNVAWVAALGHLWGDNADRGVFKTTDGGKTWRKVLYVDAKTGASDLAIDPAHPNKLFATTWQFRRWPYKFESGGPGSGMYVSYDAGESWTKLTLEDGLPDGELGRIAVGIARSNPDVVYALVEAKKSALLRSDDGGKSFRTVNAEPNVNPRPFYFCELRVDPKDPDRIYSVDYDIRVSDDAGRHFHSAVKGREIHGDHHAMWIDPADPLHFFVGNDGGVGVTYDGGKAARFVSNLPLAQYYHVAVDMDSPYHVYGGLQDNGAWRGPSSVLQMGGIRNYMWQVLVFGDGFETFPDPADSTRGYSMWQGGNIDRWDLRKAEYKDVKPAPPDGTLLRFNWNAAAAQDPFDPATIYLGSQFVHVSHDRGETWQIISPDLTTNRQDWQAYEKTGGLTIDVSNAENYTTLVTIAPSPKQQGVIWTGSDDGRIHVTQDAGKSWTSVEANAKDVPPNSWVPAIEPSPYAAGTAFVVFDNHRRDDMKTYVERTDDFGKTWHSLVASNLRGYALSIVQDPVDPNLLFLGTEFGLWTSFDAGRSWIPWKAGIPTVGVRDMVIHPREQDLVVATHGRALYIVDDIRPLREVTPEVMKEKLHLFPIAAATEHRLLAPDGGYAAGATEFRGENREMGALVTFVANGEDLPWENDKRERERKEQARAAEAARGAGAAAPAAEKSEAAAAKNPEKDKDVAVIEIRAASGQLVRTLRPKVVRGINRVAWELDRDPFETAPGQQENEYRDNGGPTVPPGVYEVTVSFRGETAKAPVEVAADPLSKNTDADWQARWKTVLEAGRLHDATVEAIARLHAIKNDVEAVVSREKLAHREDLDAHRVEAADLPLAKTAKPIEEGLDQLERQLWQPPDTVGIVPETDVMTAIGYVQGYLDSTWDPPNPTHLEYLRQAREKLATVIAAVNTFDSGKVEPFRQQVHASGPSLLPTLAPLPTP